MDRKEIRKHNEDLQKFKLIKGKKYRVTDTTRDLRENERSFTGRYINRINRDLYFKNEIGLICTAPAHNGIIEIEAI